MKWHKTEIAIGLVWLFHLSGMIGILSGNEEWFMSKTPLNLTACFVLLILTGPIDSLKKALFTLILFASGIAVEWVGVKYGVPFGEYQYGENLGTKMDEVPYLIGINWAMLVLITGSMSTRFVKSFLGRIILGSSLMVFLDLLIEPNASFFDFWYWADHQIPVSNYLAWFGIGMILHWIFQMFIKMLDFRFSLNLYLAQLIFFTSFYVYTNI